MSRRLQRQFLNPEQIDNSLYCSICQEVFLEPTSLICSHVFCKKCIIHWLHDKKTTCPICRSHINKKMLTPDFDRHEKIQELQVKCCSNLCPWQGTLEGLETHYRSCAFIETPEWAKNPQDYIKIEDDDDSENLELIDEPFSKCLDMLFDQTRLPISSIPPLFLFNPFVESLLLSLTQKRNTVFGNSSRLPQGNNARGTRTANSSRARNTQLLRNLHRREDPELIEIIGDEIGDNSDSSISDTLLRIQKGQNRRSSNNNKQEFSKKSAQRTKKSRKSSEEKSTQKSQGVKKLQKERIISLREDSTLDEDFPGEVITKKVKS